MRGRLQCGAFGKRLDHAGPPATTSGGVRPSCCASWRAQAHTLVKRLGSSPAAAGATTASTSLASTSMAATAGAAVSVISARLAQLLHTRSSDGRGFTTWLVTWQGMGKLCRPLRSAVLAPTSHGNVTLAAEASICMPRLLAAAAGVPRPHFNATCGGAPVTRFWPPLHAWGSPRDTPACWLHFRRGICTRRRHFWREPAAAAEPLAACRPVVHLLRHHLERGSGRGAAADTAGVRCCGCRQRAVFVGRAGGGWRTGGRHVRSRLRAVQVHPPPAPAPGRSSRLSPGAGLAGAGGGACVTPPGCCG